jgi:hypothetical protein
MATAEKALEQINDPTPNRTGTLIHGAKQAIWEGCAPTLSGPFQRLFIPFLGHYVLTNERA